jgi:hypothetical protein
MGRRGRMAASDAAVGDAALRFDPTALLWTTPTERSGTGASDRRARREGRPARCVHSLGLPNTRRKELRA